MSVPEATNREGVFPTVGEQASILAAVTQVQDVSVGVRTIVDPYHTPEARDLARVEETASAVAARRENGKAEGIGAVSIRIPSVCCFEHFTCC